jgi:hypothetical protein
MLFALKNFYNITTKEEGEGDVGFETNTVYIYRSCVDRFDIQVLRTLR